MTVIFFLLLTGAVQVTRRRRAEGSSLAAINVKLARFINNPLSTVPVLPQVWFFVLLFRIHSAS